MYQQSPKPVFSKILHQSALLQHHLPNRVMKIVRQSLSGVGLCENHFKYQLQSSKWYRWARWNGTRNFVSLWHCLWNGERSTVLYDDLSCFLLATPVNWFCVRVLLCNAIGFNKVYISKYLLLQVFWYRLSFVAGNWLCPCLEVFFYWRFNWWRHMYFR